MLKLIQTDWGKFDLALEAEAPGQAGMSADEAQVATLIYATLFTDVRAPQGRVADQFDQRGWWADTQAGAGLWYVRRQALTETARREAAEMVRQTLIERAPALTQLSVDPTVLDASQGVTTSALMIRGLSAGRPFLVRIPL